MPNSTGTKCRLYSAIVSKNWKQGDKDNYKDLENFKCFSSWHKRDDIIQRAESEGSPAYADSSSTSKVKNGFYCPKLNAYDYQTNNWLYSDNTWLQLDLKGFYTLKCVRVPTRSIVVYKLSHFIDVEFRFGNESQNGDYTLNPVIGFSEGMSADNIVEFCPNFNVVGRYLGLRRNSNGNFAIGEIQVTVK